MYCSHSTAVHAVRGSDGGSPADSACAARDFRGQLGEWNERVPWQGRGIGDSCLLWSLARRSDAIPKGIFCPKSLLVFYSQQVETEHCHHTKYFVRRIYLSVVSVRPASRFLFFLSHRSLRYPFSAFISGTLVGFASHGGGVEHHRCDCAVRRKHAGSSWTHDPF